MDTLMGRKLGTSVVDNGLVIPADAIGQHLRRYTFPAIFQTNLDGKFILTKSGSLAKVKTNGRYFGITAHHVISANNYELTQLCLPQIRPNQFVTSQAARFPASDTAKDQFDFICFEFTEPVNEGLINRNDWFDVSFDLSRTTEVEAIIVACLGYPSHRNSINYDESTYAIAPNLVWGDHVDSRIPNRKSFTPVNPISYEPIGMSGAPVFGLELRGQHLHLALAGILTNASPITFNYLPISNIELF
jgi:hypothetical protein